MEVESEKLAEKEVEQHVREREAALLQWHTGVYIRGVLPCTFCYFALALQPFVQGLDHHRMPMLLFGSLSLSCVAVRHYASQCRDADLRWRLQRAESVCLVARLLMHCVCIAFDGDSTHVFLKLISLWFLPLSAAKESMTVESFQIYLVSHNILVLLRFWNELGANFAWIFGTLVVDRMLLDLSNARHEGMRMRQELAMANIEIEQLAEGTTKRLFQRFCDATATLSADMHIAEPAPQLAAMLGMSESSMKGRSFTSLIDSEDLEGFMRHVEVIRASYEDQDGRKVEDTRPRVDDHNLESIQVRLLDAFAKPVPVHVFHASFVGLQRRRVYFVGLSETWRPPRSKNKKDKGKAIGSGTSSGGVSGSLMPESLIGSDPLLTIGGAPAESAVPAVRRRGNSPRPSSPRPQPRPQLGVDRFMSETRSPTNFGD